MSKQPRPAWHLYTGRAYVPAAATDIRKTFERVRQEQQAREIDEHLRRCIPTIPRLAARR